MGDRALTGAVYLKEEGSSQQHAASNATRPHRANPESMVCGTSSLPIHLSFMMYCIGTCTYKILHLTTLLSLAAWQPRFGSLFLSLVCDLCSLAVTDVQLLYLCPFIITHFSLFIFLFTLISHVLLICIPFPSLQPSLPFKFVLRQS